MTPVAAKHIKTRLQRLGDANIWQTLPTDDADAVVSGAMSCADPNALAALSALDRAAMDEQRPQTGPQRTTLTESEQGIIASTQRLEAVLEQPVFAKGGAVDASTHKLVSKVPAIRGAVAAALASGLVGHSAVSELPAEQKKALNKRMRRMSQSLGWSSMFKSDQALAFVGATHQVRRRRLGCEVQSGAGRARADSKVSAGSAESCTSEVAVVQRKKGAPKLKAAARAAVLMRAVQKEGRAKAIAAGRGGGGARGRRQRARGKLGAAKV